MSITIGVLDIQGSVEEHFAMLKKIGAETHLVKSPHDLDKVNGLIIPGGESTVISKLMKTTNLDTYIKKRHELTVWGTCAGAILLAKKITNRAPKNLGIMDIDIERNAYGRQMDSFEANIKVNGIYGTSFPAVFIRAPRVTKTGRKVKILARYKGSPVMLEQENLLATMFHPELTGDARIHKYFLSLVQRYAAKKS